MDPRWEALSGRRGGDFVRPRLYRHFLSGSERHAASSRSGEAQAYPSVSEVARIKAPGTQRLMRSFFVFILATLIAVSVVRLSKGDPLPTPPSMVVVHTSR
jgi:hypothetical protein